MFEGNRKNPPENMQLFTFFWNLLDEWNILTYVTAVFHHDS